MQPSPSESDSGPAPHRQYRFADFMLDGSRGVLTQNGEEIPLRKQAYEMLVLLLERQGELVSKDFLMDTIWSDSVVTENSVNQCLKEIRRAIGDKDLTMIRTVPRRGCIFELPVEQIETGASGKTPAATAQRLWPLGAVAFVALAALGWWVLDNSRLEEATVSTEAPTPPENSLAVLPFTNMSSDPEISYLADGMSEEILNRMAQIPNLLVTARTSSFTFRDGETDIATIGRELNVAHVLEGSVRIDDDMARVTAQLIRTADQTHLWSHSYDRPRENIFELQEGIARDVAGQLHLKLLSDSEDYAAPKHNPGAEAYAAFLRGRYLMAQRTRESVAAAAIEYGEAVAQDPDFAEAQAGLALATRFLSRTQYGELPKDEAVARARPHAERALELNPQLPQAHAAMAYVLMSPSTMNQAVSHMRRAVTLNPNYAEGAMWLAQMLTEKGEFIESFALYERAVRSDPLSMVALANYLDALLMRGRIEEAERTNQKLTVLSPRMAREQSIFVHAFGGSWAQSLHAALELMLDAPESNLPWLNTQAATFMAAMRLDENAVALPFVEDPMVFQLLGRHEAGLQLYEKLQAEEGLRPTQEWLLGRLLAATGDYAGALPHLEENWSQVDGVVAQPWFDAKAVFALITARQATGKDPETEALAAALQESASRHREAGIVGCTLFACADFEVGIAELFSGNHEAAVKHLIHSAEKGHTIPPGVAYLQVLYDDPQLAPVFEIQRGHERAQRNEFLSAVCTENPYAAVWQPIAGTCDASSAGKHAAMKKPAPGD